MLVFSCKRNERIFIGRNVVVTVADIRGDKVRIGIDAPLGIDVDREVVHRRKVEAGQIPPADFA